jgi:hypothetical protein
MTLNLRNTLQRDMLTACTVDTAPLTSVMAGWASGKTTGGAFVQSVLSAARPGTLRLAITDTYGRAERVLLPTFEKWLTPDGWEHTDAGKLWVNPRNGSQIRVVNYMRASTRASTSNPLEGINAADAWVDECQALPPEVLSKMQGRVGRDGGYPGIILCTGLPVAGAWWVEAAEKRDDARVLVARSDANAHNLPEGWLDQMRATLSPEEFAAMVEATPRPPKGQVFDTFVVRSWPDGNLLDVDPEEYRDQDITMAVDFGRQPAVLFIANDQERDLDVVVDELQPDDVDVYQLGDLINARGWRIAHAAGDPAGKARSDKGNERSLGELRRIVGVPHIRFTHEKERVSIPAGILTLRRLMCSADGQRRLVVCRSVWERGRHHGGRSIRRSFLGYRYPESGGDHPKKDGVTDHCPDAARMWAINFRWFDRSSAAPPGFYNFDKTQQAPRPTSGAKGWRPSAGRWRPRG